MFYYIKIYSKNKLKKFKKKLKIKRIFKTGGEYILKHKKIIIIGEVHTMNFT